MRDEEAQNLSRGDFKRSYGVYPETFKDMVKMERENNTTLRFGSKVELLPSQK
jgi:hypothetical protein